MSKRTRKRSQPKQPEAKKPAPPVEVTATASEPAAAVPTFEPLWSYNLTDIEPEAVDETELRAVMRDWRRGRATRNLWNVVQDGYVALLAVVMVGAMVVSGILRAQGAVSACTTASCLGGRTLLPWAALFGVLSLTLLVSRLFGPVVASAAEGFWLFEAPVKRSRLLWRRLMAVIALTGLGAGAFGALVAVLTGARLNEIVAWGFAAGLGSAGLVALAAAEQGADRTWITTSLQWLAGAVGLIALGGVVIIAAGWFGADNPGAVQSVAASLSISLALLVSAIGLALLIGAAIVATMRLDRIHRARMVSGGSLVSGMQGAMYAMDLGLMRDILVERDAARRGHVRPTRGRGSGVGALVWRELQRLVRFPKQLIGLLLSLVVPYAVGALGLGVLNPVISALILMAALVPLLGTLRVLTRTGGLARAFPFSRSQLRTAAMIVPAGCALLWSLAVIPAFVGLGDEAHLPVFTAVTHAILTGAAGFLGAVRWVVAKPVDYNKPMVQTGFGAMPPGMFVNIIKGFDVVVLITIPLLFGWPEWISLGIALLTFVILRGSFNTEEMQAMRDQQQKQLADARAGTKAGSPGEKRKIPPPAGR